MSASSHRGSYHDEERSYRPSSSHTSHSSSLKSASRDAPARPQSHAQSHSAKDNRPSSRHSPPRSPSPSHARLRILSSSATTASPLRTPSIPPATSHPVSHSHGSSSPSASHPLLSSDALQELRSAFQVFDRDGDGRVPTSLILATLRSLPPHPSHALLSSLLPSSPATGSHGSTLTFDEFVALLTSGGSSGDDSSSSSSGRAEWERVFALMDEGGKGLLDESDMERVRRTVVGGAGKGGGAGGGGGGKSELRAMLTRADLNGDGVVSRDEFVALMMEDKLV